jgi:hypothetical protein
MSDKAKAEAEAKAKEETAAKAEVDKKAAADKAKAEAEAKAKAAARKPFHVVGPGSVLFGGEGYPAGSLLELTAEEAAGLGEAVAAGKPKPAPRAIEKRVAGRYRVAGPGLVQWGGRPREKGFELDLSAEEARSLGAAVEETE